jgi:hypothetical protein
MDKEIRTLMKEYLEKITPNVSDAWRADEVYVKVKDNPKYLFALMDDQTPFWIAQQVADTKYTSNIHISYVQYGWKNKEVNDFMGYGYCGTSFHRARSYLTKEERIALLKEYKDELEKEGQGVVERIKELEAS